MMELFDRSAGARTCALFSGFLRALRRALCTPVNGLKSLAVTGFAPLFFATTDYKLCALPYDGRVSHIVIFCAALVTRQHAKTGKECPQQARADAIIVKSFSTDFCYRLKRLADNSNKKRVF